MSQSTHTCVYCLGDVRLPLLHLISHLLLCHRCTPADMAEILGQLR